MTKHRIITTLIFVTVVLLMLYLVAAVALAVVGQELCQALGYDYAEVKFDFAIDCVIDNRRIVAPLSWGIGG